MFEGIHNGWDMFKESFKVFARYPVMIFPLLLVWCVYAPVILYLRYGIKWKLLSDGEAIFILTAFIFGFTFLLAVSCSILLELIEQIETGKNPDLIKAVFDTMAFNLIKMIPIIIIWTIIWLILSIIEAILRRRKRSYDDDDESMTARGAAETLAGHSENFSLSSAFIDALKKGVRMIVFLILPGIAWENLSCYSAVKKGFTIFRQHLYEFTAGFLLTEFAALIIFTPPAVMFLLGSSKKGRPPIIEFPDFAWYLTIVYIAFAWSYTIYLEQMFVAELYLWHLKWEREYNAAQSELEYKPVSFYDVKRPSLLDDVSDLVNNLPQPVQKKIARSPWSQPPA